MKSLRNAGIAILIGLLVQASFLLLYLSGFLKNFNQVSYFIQIETLFSYLISIIILFGFIKLSKISDSKFLIYAYAATLIFSFAHYSSSSLNLKTAQNFLSILAPASSVIFGIALIKLKEVKFSKSAGIMFTIGGGLAILSQILLFSATPNTQTLNFGVYATSANSFAGLIGQFLMLFMFFKSSNKLENQKNDKRKK